MYGDMLTATVEVDDVASNRIAIESTYRCKNAIKTIPGAKWNADRRIWTVPLTWPSCLALRSEFAAGLTIGEKLRAWAVDEAAYRLQMTEICKAIELPDGVTLPALPELDGLFPHQQAAARMIDLGERVLILDETGAGKTRSALAGVRMINERANALPMLVVAPKSVVPQWARNEIPRFFPGADIREITGTPSQVKKLLEPGGDIYVISWGMLRTYSRLSGYGSLKLTDNEKLPKELQAIPFQTIIADEIHRAKTPGSKQTRALWTVAEACMYRIGLTGSPVQDTPDELWSILRAIRPEEYGSKTAWMDRFVLAEMNGWGGREIIGLHPIHGPEFLTAFDTFHSRVTKAQVLPFLPDKTYETRWVDLPPKLRRSYNEMRDKLLAELESGAALAAGSPLEAAGRLVQLANASGNVDEDGQFTMALPSPKIEAFMSDLADGDYGDQQLVIFSDSRQLADLLVTEMRRKKYDVGEINGSVTGDARQAVVDKFQAGDLRYVVCTRAGAEGITLTAASTMIRLARPWSSVVHMQAEDRIHRIGSEKHDVVTYVDYISLDTIEEAQVIRFNDKKRRAQEILRDDLKDLLR